MRRHSPKIEKMLLLSVSFTLFLVIFRIAYWGEIQFLFYPWNLLLASIPLFISRRLRHYEQLNLKVLTMLMLWLLFLPNAPYVITDIFHF